VFTLTFSPFCSGPIQGKLTPDGLARAFRGIPFAEPPNGQFRWQAPRNVTPWTSTLNAESDAAGCIQNCKLPPIACPPVQSEDCLFLNVFTPRLDTINQPLPVMVFIHGVCCLRLLNSCVVLLRTLCPSHLTIIITSPVSPHLSIHPLPLPPSVGFLSS
jgi:Carboxylesterase family